MPERIPRGRGLLFLALLSCLGGAFVPVYAGGKPEAAGPEPRNKEWVLCVTAFDVSALPPSRRLMGEVLARSLLDSLKLVEFRQRLSREYTYYEDYAWFRTRSEAAKKLAAKRNERDMLIYRGEPNWKYRNSLKTIEADIKKLEEEFIMAGETIPVIVTEPEFRFAEGNNNGAFPAPPHRGGEYRFCMNQRADAFLTGAVSEFHGRLFINVKMYTVYTRSFQYDDGIIFSSDDISAAMDELAGRLVAAVSGMDPAFIAVYAKPGDATVMINGSFAGRGTLEPREHPPGEAELEIFADGYETVSRPVELLAGELAEMYINLRPISKQALTINVPEKPGTLVYRGALYLGEVPHTLTMPADQYEYIHVETPEGETGTVVVQGRGRAAAAPPIFDVRVTMPPDPEQKPVERSRRQFYGAYGRFWIALPVAFILGGMYTVQLEAYNRNITEAMYEDSMKYYYLSTGATVLAGAALTETLYRLFRYISTSGTNTTPPIVK